MAQRVVVIGGSGLVGTALINCYAAKGIRVDGTYFTRRQDTRERLDVRDVKAVADLVARSKPNVVFVPAANPFVDYCERHPEETRAINVGGPANVLAACRPIGARVVFFSSDYVFDGGKSAPYQETDPTNPLSEYGRQKLEAEKLVLQPDGANLVIRTSGVYGWQSEPKNFVMQVLDGLMQGKEFRVVRDIAYNPTSIMNLAQAAIELVEKWPKSGIFHIVGSQTVTRLQFARIIATSFGLGDRTHLLREVEPAEFPQSAKRPKFSALDATKALGILTCRLWDVNSGLEEMKKSDPNWRTRFSSTYLLQ